MSVVERSVEKLQETRPSIGRMRKPESRRSLSDVRAPERIIGGPDTGASVTGSSALDTKSAVFQLDEDALRKQGFFTPDTKYLKLSSEFRTIKRRLLRRLSFYKLENERRQTQKVNKRQPNMVLLTSTRPAEGKTFTAINLALSLAIEDGISVLLIDADVPRPKVLAHFGLEADRGLTDLVLDPSLNASDLLLRVDGYPLSILPQGRKILDHEEVFTKKEMSSLVFELSARYPDRIIIFDAPPVLAGHDATILARHVDEVVFVVEANGTPKDAVTSAIEELRDATDCISLVLNKCSVPESSQQHNSYKEYYTKEHLKRGHKDL